MHTDRDTTRIVRSWLEEGATALPDRVLDAVLDQVPATRQRRAWWPAWRFADMNTPIRIAIAAAAVVIVALVGINVLPKSGGVGGLPSPTPSPGPTSPSPGPTPSPSPTALPAALPDGLLAAGTYDYAPFGTGPGLDSTCMQPPPSGCVDPGAPILMRVTLTVPAGWESHGLGVWIDSNAPPGGAALGFNRGGWLYSAPCRTPDTTDPDIPVGPTVDDFVNALANHPMLDTTTPVDVTVDVYTGKALDLQVPADISQCDVYRPWQPNIYAQGPGHLWHLRVIDVDGDRVVIESMEYAGTASPRRSELQAIVDSIQIEP